MSEQITRLSFKATNLGIIRKGEFTQKPLTVFCGPNNSGKTWAMYSLYYFYQNFRFAKWWNEKRKVSLAIFNENMSLNLAGLFNTPKE